MSFLENKNTTDVRCRYVSRADSPECGCREQSYCSKTGTYLCYPLPGGKIQCDTDSLNQAMENAEIRGVLASSDDISTADISGYVIQPNQNNTCTIVSHDDVYTEAPWIQLIDRNNNIVSNDRLEAYCEGKEDWSYQPCNAACNTPRSIPTLYDSNSRNLELEFNIIIPIIGVILLYAVVISTVLWCKIKKFNRDRYFPSRASMRRMGVDNTTLSAAQLELSNVNANNPSPIDDEEYI